MLRWLAVVASLGPCCAAAFAPVGVLPTWSIAALAVAAAVPIAWQRRTRIGMIVLAVGLAAVAGHTSSDLPSRYAASRGEFEALDLSSADLSAAIGSWKQAEGVLVGQNLDEYGVRRGTRPDQNAPSRAVVRRLVATADVDPPAEYAVLVRLANPEVQSLRGRVEKAPPTVAAALGCDPESAILLDTTVLPSLPQVWTAITLAFLCACTALGLLLFATRPPRTQGMSSGA